MGKPINEKVVLDHWDDVLRLAASIKTLSVKPSGMLRKLGAYRQQNRLYFALGEIGRIERTLFMLDWIEIPCLRMECQAGLSKGEARHSLAKAVFAHSPGRIYDRSHDAQQKRVMALNLVIAAIIYCNTTYMDRATGWLRRQGRLPEPKLLAHVSPLGWEHINLAGDYNGCDSRMAGIFEDLSIYKFCAYSTIKPPLCVSLGSGCHFLRAFACGDRVW